MFAINECQNGNNGLFFWFEDYDRSCVGFEIQAKKYWVCLVRYG